MLSDSNIEVTIQVSAVARCTDAVSRCAINSHMYLALDFHQNNQHAHNARGAKSDSHPVYDFIDGFVQM